jgi:putative MATE family efflux protein
MIFSKYILRLVNTPAEAFDYALLYLRIIFAGMIFTLGYNLVCAIQRGFGDSKSSMYFVLAATISNIVLDYIFIATFNLGVSGAAYATIISQALSFVLSVAYFRSKKHIITFHPKELCFEKAIAKEIFKIGLPNAIQQGTVNFAYLVLNGIVNGYGLIATAAYGICAKLDSFAVLPCSAVNDAVASVTSQNLGVGQKERAMKGISTGRKLLLPFNICTDYLV